jgi:hypothetical protein
MQSQFNDTYWGKAMTELEINSMVKDLMKKRPKGSVAGRKLAEDGQLEYGTARGWCTRYHKYRDLETCNSTWWGYTWEEIVGAGIWSWNHFEARLDALGIQATSRKENRYHDRISAPLRTKFSVVSGYPGVYTAYATGDSYNRITLGYVLASSTKDAIVQAKMYYSGYTTTGVEVKCTDPFAGPLKLQNRVNSLGVKLDQEFERETDRHDRRIAELNDARQGSMACQMVGLDLVEAAPTRGTI